MELEINSKKYVLRFGIGFVRKLNLAAGLKVNVQGVNTSMGMGLGMVLPSLNAGDPAALSDVIWAAAQNKANSVSLTQAAVDDYLEGDADIAELTTAVISELKESNATKESAKNFLN